ncbi:hypothetical protein BGZ76_008932 [Entomortierella beljakovae]|nr:hypothetical protein BGZ76_008932 [Entomortierella beljakovae]
MRTPFNNATSYPHAHFTSSTSSPPLDDSAGGIFPYTSANNFDFSRCTNPAQLEKSIVSYLKSHPMPGERALLAMLTACADISRTVAPSHEQDHQPHKTWDQIKPKRNNSSDRFSTNLLQTILQSFEFTPEDVFKIARSVYYDIPKGSFAGGAYSNTISLTKPSLDVTNTFLHVCETTGHFDEAWLVVNEMMNRKQGDVKPDLATYRYVLRAAALQRRRHTGESLDIAEIDTKVDGIIEYASNSLSKQSRIALLVKLGLGGLVGATAFKFTMMGVMALPSLSTFSKSIEDLGKEQSTVVGAHQPDGIIHFLASQEVALGVGLAAGLLTASYFIRGSTQKIAVNAKQEPALKSRNQQIQDDLPRASIFGLYFPDLKTTSKSEIQNYLRKNAGL